jgi:hypothetical protein
MPQQVHQTARSRLLPNSSLEFPSLGGHHNENHLTTQNLLKALSTMASIVLVRIPGVSLIQLLLKTSHAKYTKNQPTNQPTNQTNKQTQSHRFHLHVLFPSLLLSQAQPWQLQQPPNQLLPIPSTATSVHTTQRDFDHIESAFKQPKAPYCHILTHKTFTLMSRMTRPPNHTHHSPSHTLCSNQTQLPWFWNIPGILRDGAWNN